MTIEQIKEKLSIKDVLAHYGYTINRNQHINCPFHEDKNPSMKVYADTNTVYCFSGNCSTHGHSLDVIEFVTKHEKCSKHKALNHCKSMINGNHIEWTISAERAHDKIWEALKQSMYKAEKAKSYLRSRGLSTKGVGYHSGRLLNSKLEQEAKETGLIKDSKPWASQCIIYPLKNALDKVVSFYGRSLTAGHFYQTGRSGLYPKYPSKSAKRIILTESIIDAATLLEIKALKGYEILALFGTNGLTVEHKGALKNLEQLEEVILMLDGDAAGIASSKKYEQELSDLLSKTKIRIAELPKDTDVNELWANHESEELFLELLAIKQEQEVASLDTSNANNLVFKGSYAVYYIKGFNSLKSLDSLKITLVTANEDGKKYRGKVELYEDREVQKYSKSASEKLGINADLLDIDISLLTDQIEAYRESQEEEEPSHRAKPKLQLSTLHRKQGQAFLKEKNLFKRLNEQIGKTGIVGEQSTRLLLLIVASSYKCKDTLHALIQGSSGSGKTLLLRKIMEMIPESDSHVWTRISDKSLYHAGTKYKNSCIAVEDWDGLSEEVQYVMREMQSGKRLSSTITQKLANGKMDNVEILAEGPISSLMCTTQGSIYEDNMSRCLLVAVDESEEQTERILNYQYQKDRGELDNKEEEQARDFIQRLVYLLEVKTVVNPFAGKIELPRRVHKIRRLNQLFQCFVKQVTWWHQGQREQDKKGRLITTKEDVQLAIDLLFETIVLKVDELDGSLRSFFERLKDYVLNQEEKEKYRFGRREMRLALNISKSQVERYIRALLELEYIQQVGGHANRGFIYQVSYWDDNKGLRETIKSTLTEQLNKL